MTIKRGDKVLYGGEEWAVVRGEPEHARKHTYISIERSLGSVIIFAEVSPREVKPVEVVQ